MVRAHRRGPRDLQAALQELLGGTPYLVAELWFYPDGTRILELSTKCAPAEALRVAMEAKAFLAERDIDLSGKQQTKTRTALNFFSKEVQAAAR